MPAGRPPRQIPVPKDDIFLADLRKLSKSRTEPAQDVMRAKIVCMAMERHSNKEIAKAVHCSERTVQKWRKRFSENPTWDGLKDEPRPGRPRIIPPHVKQRILVIACDRPANYGFTLRGRWTQELIARVFTRETGFPISSSEVQRVLQNGDTRPHRVKGWLHSPDPDFEKKNENVNKQYAKAKQGATVICVDEKPIQVTGRRYPRPWS